MLHTKLALQVAALNVCFCYALAPDSRNETQFSSNAPVGGSVTHQNVNSTLVPHCDRFSQNEIIVLTKNTEGKHLYLFDPVVSPATVGYLGKVTLAPNYRTTKEQGYLKYIKDIALDSKGCLFALGRTYRLGSRGETYLYQLDDMSFEAQPKGTLDDRYGFSMIFSGYSGEVLTGGSFRSKPPLRIMGFNMNDLSSDTAVKVKKRLSLDLPSWQKIVSVVRPMTYDFMLYSIVYKPPRYLDDTHVTMPASALYKLACRQGEEGSSTEDMVSEKIFEVHNFQKDGLHGLAVYMDDVYMGRKNTILKVKGAGEEPEIVARIPNGHHIIGMASRHYLANTATISPETENSGWTCSTGDGEL
jgi:hypothetical protein